MNRYSILDLATVGSNATIGAALADSVTIAQCAEARGYARVWYAEHHNMSAIASSATSVLIAHVAAHTETIRLGSGGIMLPNHAPLVIAEQFGTLASLYPDRIDLGIGRAPGTDQQTMRALRRDHTSADSFPQDVRELQGFLGCESEIPGVRAIPGYDTNVPIYILGSSLYGAQFAAVFGLPYAFASHFAPDSLVEAVHNYRRNFRPSAQCDSPYVIAAVNAIVGATETDAVEESRVVTRARVARFLAGGRTLSDDELDALIDSRQGRHVLQMMRYSAVGTAEGVLQYLNEFRVHADADELMIVLASRNLEGKLRSLHGIADAVAGSAIE